jgi:hypothetical protein
MISHLILVSNIIAPAHSEKGHSLSIQMSFEISVGSAVRSCGVAQQSTINNKEN